MVPFKTMFVYTHQNKWKRYREDDHNTIPSTLGTIQRRRSWYYTQYDLRAFLNYRSVMRLDRNMFSLCWRIWDRSLPMSAGVVHCFRLIVSRPWWYLPGTDFVRPFFTTIAATCLTSAHRFGFPCFWRTQRCWSNKASTWVLTASIRLCRLTVASVNWPLEARLLSLYARFSISM